MKISSFELSRTFLDTVSDVTDDRVDRLADSFAFELLEGPEDLAALLARDNGVVGRMVVEDETGAPTVFALKLDAD
ncbi:hypothetical protein [Pseudaestuariivita atlantica]|nr:hypothetical protein [Pseudaestuariivita atlantica]